MPSVLLRLFLHWWALFSNIPPPTVQMSLLLSKHMMMALPDGSTKKLVAFSDSRQAAAKLSDDVEREQWSHLIQHAVSRAVSASLTPKNSTFSSELLVICDQKGFAEGAKFVAESKPKLNDREFHELLMIFKVYQFISEHPELADDTQKDQLLQPKTRMYSLSG